MARSATRKHLVLLGREIVTGFLVRFCLVGAANATLWVTDKLLMIETHGSPTAIKGILTASVLLLISLSWVFVTVWLSYRLNLSVVQIKENIAWLRKLLF